HGLCTLVVRGPHGSPGISNRRLNLADRRSLRGRVTYAVRAATAAARRPQQSAEYALERVSEWRDRHRQPWPYEATEASEALEHNGAGHLWSIDLPPFVRGDSQETAVAVPARLYERWTFLRGSSRQLLPSLLADLGRVDVFVHDSMHTSRNMRFELEQMWPA